jgi:hypothetical protein
MNVTTFKLAATVALPLILGGCVSAAEYSQKNSGFSSVSNKTAEATGKDTVWIQNRHDAQAVSGRVKTLLSKKNVDVETAVQVALLNNKGLRQPMPSSETLLRTRGSRPCS